MGTNAVATILGLLLVFGIINSGLNQRDKRTAEETYGYMKYTAAREIAHSAIGVALKSVEDSSSLSSVSGQLDGGTYTVTMPRVGDTVHLTSTAQFSQTSYQIRTILRVYPKPFPGVNSAVALHVEDVGFGITNGKNNNPALTIDGYNHDTSGVRLYDTLGVAGVSVLDPEDTAKVLTPPYPNQIDGISDAIADTGMPNPADYVDEYISQADTIISATKPISGNSVFGSFNDPWIVYIDGGADSAHTLKINGNITGWGILVIHGSVQFNGTMTWKGLTVVYSNTHLEFSSSSGNSTFIGSVIVGGPPGSTFSTNGSAAFQYSTATLSMAQWIGSLLAYNILEWYE